MQATELLPTRSNASGNATDNKLPSSHGSASRPSGAFDVKRADAQNTRFLAEDFSIGEDIRTALDRSIGERQLGMALGMSAIAYRAFAGLTAYAVSQVIAAASSLGAAAVQMGTLVKLVRVLMLGPICLVLSLIAPRLAALDEPEDAIVAGPAVVGGRP
jgi:hypothetical protein